MPWTRKRRRTTSPKSCAKPTRAAAARRRSSALFLGILAGAGAGDRLGADVPKAFIRCAGRELWEWSADTMREVCDRVVMAVPPDGVPQSPGLSDIVDWVPGGAHRSESVRNALAVAPDADIVVVHDAARPFASAELFRACIAAVEAGADAAVAAAPVTDTIKEADDGGRVIRTLDRSRLWSIQTPQAFRADVLRRALEGDVANATDDASLVEALGGEVRIVESSASNFKVTWPEDLARAESLLC